ncbi:hypothetical protein RB151_014050 [Providencia rettgeri]|nr:hypothetical protein RB151_014050 [Providencia rettgeri]
MVCAYFCQCFFPPVLYGDILFFMKLNKFGF